MSRNEAGSARSSGSTDTDGASEQSEATRFNSLSRLEERMSRDFFDAKCRAKASPIPLEAPVIQTTLFSNFDLSIYFSGCFTTIYRPRKSGTVTAVWTCRNLVAEVRVRFFKRFA